MSDNVNINDKVSGWWAASSDAGHEQVSLYEVLNGRESLLEVMTVTVDDFPSLEDFKIEVKRIFGGGIYVAAVRGPGGTFAKRPQFAISGRPIRDKAEEGQPVGQVGSVDRLAELIAQGNQNMLAMLAKMAEKPEAPDAFEMMERAANLLHRNGAAPAPAKSLVEQLQEMRTAAELMGLTDKADTEETGSGWAKDLINTFGPALVGSMGGLASQGDELAHDTAPAAPVNEQEQALKRLKMILLSLVQLAEYDVTPGKAVQGIEKSAGKHWPMLQAIIKRDDAVILAAQMVPAVADHKEWFEQFRAAVIGEPGTTGAKNGSTEKQPGIKKSAANRGPGAVAKRGTRHATNA